MFQPTSPVSSRSYDSSAEFRDTSIKYNCSRDSTVPTLDLSTILYIESHTPLTKNQPLRHMIQSPRPKPVVKTMPISGNIGCLNFFRKLLTFNNIPSRNAVVPLSENDTFQIK